MATRQGDSISKKRAAYRAKGFVMLPERWVHPDDKERLKRIIERLNKQREKRK